MEEQNAINAFNRLCAAASSSMGNAQYHDQLREDAKIVAIFITKFIEKLKEEDNVANSSIKNP